MGFLFRLLNKRKIEKRIDQRIIHNQKDAISALRNEIKGLYVNNLILDWEIEVLRSQLNSQPREQLKRSGTDHFGNETVVIIVAQDEKRYMAPSVEFVLYKVWQPYWKREYIKQDSDGRFSPPKKEREGCCYIDKHKDHLYIVDFIPSSQKGAGYGSLLMQQIIQYAIDQPNINFISGGLSWVDLDDKNDPEHRSRLIHFYQKHGFDVNISEERIRLNIVREAWMSKAGSEMA